MKTGILLSMRGRLGGPTLAATEEQFSFGLWFANPNGALALPSQAYMDAIAQRAAASWKIFCEENGSIFQGNVWATEVRSYQYAATDTANVVAYGEVLNPAGGPTSTYTHTFQDALVVTLEAAGRVKPKSGRVYLPPVVFALQSNGRLLPADVLKATTRFETFCIELEQIVGSTSPTGATTATGGGFYGSALRLVITSTVPGRANTVVATIRCGDVMDTQRRRRNALKETYQEITLQQPAA